MSGFSGEMLIGEEYIGMESMSNVLHKTLT